MVSFRREETMRDSVVKSNQTGCSLSAPRILVIDDEVDMLTNYSRLLKRAGHDCLTSTDPSQLETLLADFRPDLVITDLIMPNESGLEVLERVKEFDEEIPVILVTAYGSIESAVEAMKHSAADYLTKPFSVNELLGRIQESLSRRLTKQSGTSFARTEPESADWRKGIIGISPVMQAVLDLVRKVAKTDINVLVVGESGTGKEVIARAIHKLSARNKQIFVPVDCASLPEHLLESELFGYRKGAFTGATSDKMGLFEFAHKGTLFLDEIGHMPLDLQAKLLRVLQERQFRPIGGREETEIDVRVIAATNRDLNQALRDKTLRSDLYYRLNVVTLCLPLLRDRPEDIPLLANHFLRQFAKDNRLPLDTISPKALEYLKMYSWPGNVRELLHVIEHAATLATGSMIDVADLPKELQSCKDETGDSIISQECFFSQKKCVVSSFEREYLISLLVENRFNITRAAAAAGCHRRTLYRMIHRNHIDIEAIKEQRRALREEAHNSRS
jgi:two-component system response regulator AtoC